MSSQRIRWKGGGKRSRNMSKLSQSLKALIAAPHARPNTLPASKSIRSAYERIRDEAVAKNVGVPAWLALSVSISSSPFNEMILMTC